jgi:hypothetical protein
VLQELAARTGATAWAIGSMLFFLAAWVAVVVWVARKGPEEFEARARLPLEGDPGPQGDQAAGRRPGAASKPK